jgi:lipopolysaccharide biosynthesis regulator YciM
MIRAFTRRALFAAAAVVVFAFVASPAAAQTGAVKGKVVDAQGQPIDGAKVTIQSAESATRRHETKTNKKGEFFQIGLAPGPYKVTAEKDKLSQTHDVRVRLGDPQNINFVLAPGVGSAPGGGYTKEEIAKKETEIKKAFEEAVKLSQDGKDAESIAKFNEIITTAPKCTPCYSNIGALHLKAKNYAEAEAAYKQAVAIDPAFAPAHAGLVNVYNAQRKFAEAEAAAAEQAKAEAAAGGATGGGVSAAALFNQGIIAWNSSKIPEAKKAFEDAVKADPNFADAHYWLGMANLNQGKLQEAVPEFEAYLTLAPTGQYAETAKGVLAQIKK